MDIGELLTWARSLGLSASESLLAMGVLVIASAFAGYFWRAEQRDAAERLHQQQEHLAGRTSMQAMIDRLLDELARHSSAAPSTARSLESLDARIERIERALMERRR